MKNIATIIIGYIFILFGTLSLAYANPFLDGDAEIPYCTGDDCGLQTGVDLVETSVKDVKTEGTFSDFIQEIIVYLLGFITLVAVIYVIYAGFRILVSSGDEEVIKKSKNTIIYVVIGIVVIWLAWTIANFAIQLAAGGA